jgi:hypothetical protein
LALAELEPELGPAAAMMSPCARPRGCEIRSPLTKVPCDVPLSATTKRPSTHSSERWRRLVPSAVVGKISESEQCASPTYCSVFSGNRWASSSPFNATMLAATGAGLVRRSSFSIVRS